MENHSETVFENVTRLSYRDKEIILIPTAHVSKQSVELVRRVAEAERPDSICVELDEDRYKSIQNPDAWKNTDIARVIRDKKVGFLAANLILGSYQKKIAQKLETNPGQEMLQGIASANELNAELVLADRKIQTTFLRIWRKMGFIEKYKLIFNLVFSFDDEETDDMTEESLGELLKGDMLEAAMRDVHENFPGMGRILIDERDSYLAYKIKNAPGPKVVAVLGGAHVAGVAKEIFEEQDPDELSKLPPPSPLTKIAKWIIPVFLVAILVYGFTRSSEIGLQQVKTWVLCTSLTAAAFSALALAHPLTVLTSLIAAPFTSVNPALACGWFAGLSEAYLRRPRVADIESVPDVILSVKGFFKNRFLRIILIVAMTNLGAMIGKIIAGLSIIKHLF